MMNMPTITEDSLKTGNGTGEYISTIFSCKSLENIKNVIKKNPTGANINKVSNWEALV